MEQYFLIMIINIVFLGIILHSLSKRKNITLLAKMLTSKKVIIVISSIAIIGLAIYLNNTWQFLLTGIMGAAAFALSSIFDGITREGIQIRRNLLISLQPWNGLKRIKLIKGDYLTLDYTGNKSSRSVYFEREDYDKLMEILDKNLEDNMQVNVTG